MIQNPFSHDPILLVPAIHTDFALFHAPYADRHGNVLVGTRRELATMAHAAACTLVPVARLLEVDLRADEQLAVGMLYCLYVDQVAVVPGGALRTARLL